MDDARDLLDATAGEYVIGTLDDAERAAFARRLSGDRAARAAVAAWRARLAPLLEMANEVAPPANIWPAIEARTRPAANDDRVSPVWRRVAVAASVLALAGGALALRPPPPAQIAFAPAPTGPSYVAAVTARGAEPALLVTIDAATGRAVVRAIGLTPPARRSLELWYIGAGHDPQSLGIVAGDMRAEMAMGAAIARGDKLDASLFAVTVEPVGGAPGGVPSGDILYSGKVMPLSGT